jgi:hypothetical protein
MIRSTILAAALIASPAAAWCPGVVADGHCRTDSAVDYLRDPDFDLTLWRGGIPQAGQPALILDRFQERF